MKNKQTKWKPKEGERYWVIDKTMDNDFGIRWYFWMQGINLSNCFRTKKEAQQKLREIKEILKN